MLEHVRIDNFKSLINVTFQPQQLNLLVGLNNSGKTTLCQALKFVSGTAHAPLDVVADQMFGIRSGLSNFYFNKRTIDWQITAHLEFEGRSLRYVYNLSITNPYVGKLVATQGAFEVDEERLTVSDEGFDDVELINSTRSGLSLVNENEFVAGRVHSAKSWAAPRESTILFRMFDESIHPRVMLFKRYLASFQYYSLLAHQANIWTHTPNQLVLNADGSNLASALWQLQSVNPRVFRAIEKDLRDFDPKIDLIRFIPTDSAVYFQFENAKGLVTHPHHISRGTILYLALLYIMHSLPERPESRLVMIDEPEDGLYVGALKQIVDLAIDSGQQFIFTSHSPYFVDLFDDHLEGLFTMKAGPEHAQLANPDAAMVKKRLERFSLGEQHFREMLQ